jgi:hypothetical protein
MPKLDGTHIVGRLRGRLDELREGKEIAARDLRALLTEKQVAEMDEAWLQQQALRKKKRARTKEEEVELGWKTKREIQIEAYELAYDEARDNEAKAWEKRVRDVQVRQARIYMDSYSKARKEGREVYVAENLANNDLTRAGLLRVDGQKVWHQIPRDKEIWEMEQQIQQRARSEMTPEELEQIEIWEEHEKALAKNRKKQGL